MYGGSCCSLVSDWKLADLYGLAGLQTSLDLPQYHCWSDQRKPAEADTFIPVALAGFGPDVVRAPVGGGTGIVAGTNGYHGITSGWTIPGGTFIAVQVDGRSSHCHPYLCGAAVDTNEQIQAFHQGGKLKDGGAPGQVYHVGIFDGYMVAYGVCQFPLIFCARNHQPGTIARD